MEYEKKITLEGDLTAYINYRNVDRIYSLACDMHGIKEMRSHRTWIYNLSSKKKISEIIENKGEYILFEFKDKPIGLVCFSFRVSYRPLDNPGEIITMNEWEIGGLLIHKDYRRRGFSRPLFKLAIKRLREKTGANKAYVIVTGTFNEISLNEARETSKGVEKLCKELDGRIIGYAKDSYGPVYELNIC